MKKRKENAGMPENQSLNNTEMYADEELNLDELLNVEGGIEGPIENQKDFQENCGLGCFTGGVTNPDQTK